MKGNYQDFFLNIYMQRFAFATNKKINKKELITQ